MSLLKEGQSAIMLEGIRVLSFTHVLQGPVAGQMLADLGAEVIKIEAPKGAYERGFAPMNSYYNGVSVMHLSVNRNTKSIAVDMRSEEGREFIRRLLPSTDVIIQNFRPGVLEKYGFGYEQLKDEYPGLIYCNISGYGPDGPYKALPGQDLLAQAKSGFCYCTGVQGQAPVAVGTAVIDTHGAAIAAYGILAALVDRIRTGRGHKIDSCLLNAALNLQIEPFGAYLAQGHIWDKLPSGCVTRVYDVPYGIYQTKDDYILLSKTPIAKLQQVFGMDAFGRFESNDVFDRREEVDAAVAEEFKKKTTAEWLEILAANDCWFSKINSYEDVENDPQVQFNGIIAEFEHPRAGKVRTLGNPLLVDGQNVPVRKAAPELGENTVELLREVRFSEEEIRAMLDKGAVVQYREAGK